MQWCREQAERAYVTTSLPASNVVTECLPLCVHLPNFLYVRL